ncbi:MAG: HAMP domain-containing sensor histidine kinase [Pseudomonadota bacterium]
MSTRVFFGSLPKLGLRALALTVAAMLLLNFLVLVAASYLDTRKLEDVDLFGPPLLRQAAAAATLLESLDDAQMRAALAALNSPMLHFEILDDFSATPSIEDPLPVIVPIIQTFRSRLQGRPFSVYVRDRGYFGWRIRRNTADIYEDIILVLRLKDGSGLAVELGTEYQRLLARNVYLYIVAVVGLVLVGLIAWASFSYAQPLARLAALSQRFSRDLQAEPMPADGPQPVRDLAAALNEMQRQLRNLVGERTATLAAIAHDMRTYLTRLRMRVEFIEGAEPRARAIRDLDDVTQLIEDALSLGEAGTRPPRRDDLDVAAFLTDFVERRRDMGADAEVSLAAPPGAAGARLATDEGDVTRALDNLVDNALRYGGSAAITAALTAEGGLEICVADRGPGVPEEMLETVTKPFIRLETSRSRETGGAGLGLAIAAARAERAGAGLKLANHQDGGLRASLAFPADRVSF